MVGTLRCIAGLLAAMMLVMTFSVRAGDASKAEIDGLKRDIEELRKRLNTSTNTGGKTPVDRALEGKYGPNTSVTTKSGKLAIGGLVQVWYTSFQNDNSGLFDDPTVNGIADTNEGQDNDSFRIRRTELKFTMEIHENVTAVVMIDPAREATSFPNVTDNQGLFKRANQVAPEFDAANGPGLGSGASIGGVQSGSGAAPRLLQDAYINYHGVIPHHDFQIGQFKPALGEEGIRSSAELDFAERSFVGQIFDNRDLGVQAHGVWWDERFQYWVGAFNGAGNYHQSAGQASNRSDDNDEKDFTYRLLIRPLWKSENWGSLELGMSSSFGTHGEASGSDPINAPINGLNRNQSWAMRHDAWASYMPGGPVKGWWLRGEWAWLKDRNAPGTVVDLLAAGGTDIGNGGSGSGLAQSNGRPFISQGWNLSTGYKISDGVFSDSAPSWLKPFEIAFRYDVFENVEVADLGAPNHTDVFKTQVWTGGINYYIKGHNAKIQLNYNIVDDPSASANGGNRKLHEVSNNSFVAAFQVAF